MTLTRVHIYFFILLYTLSTFKFIKGRIFVLRLSSHVFVTLWGRNKEKPHTMFLKESIVNSNFETAVNYRHIKHLHTSNV